MKRLSAIFLSLLSILLITSGGIAESEQYGIAEIHQQAESRWLKTYESHGRVIRVDIPVKVPEAPCFPALTASLMPYSDAVKKPEPNGEVERVFDGEYSVDNHRVFFTCLRGDYYKLERLGCYNGSSGSGSFEEQDFYPPDIDLDVPYATNNVATPQYLIDLVDRVWKRYFPDIDVDLRLQKLKAGVHFKKFDMNRLQYVGEPLPTDREASLTAVFMQYMRDIPLLACAEDSFRRFGGTEKGRNDFRVVPHLEAQASSESLNRCGLPDRNDSVYFSLLKEVATLAPDLPLCSVEKVISAYEKLIEAGQLRLVDRLELGYVAWNGPGEEEYTLMPAWVAWGILVKNPAKEAWKQNADETLEKSNYQMSTQYGPIMVNAQTGELIDPWRTDRNRSFDLPRLLLWK